MLFSIVIVNLFHLLPGVTARTVLSIGGFVIVIVGIQIIPARRVSEIRSRLWR